MKVDYSQLRERFARMTDEEFALERREDLDQRAQPFYDEERMRRTPGWRYTEPPPPTPEAKAQDLAAERSRILRRFRNHVVLWVLVTGLLPLILIGIFPLMITALCIAWELLDLRRTGRVVVWLRRFNVRERGGIRFSHLLSRASKGIGLPVTVQDSAFRLSLEWAFVRFVSYWPLFLLPALAVPLIPPQLLRTIVPFLFAAVAVAWFAFLISSRRFGWKALHKPDARPWAQRFLQRVRHGGGRFAGVVVLKCEDDFWRDLGQVVLANADAVVLDVSRPSESLLWELRTALSLMPAECILLACGLDRVGPIQLPFACGLGANEPLALPPNVTLELENAIGKETLGRVGRFLYPRSPHVLGPWMSYDAGERLEEFAACLIRCVSYSRH